MRFWRKNKAVPEEQEDRDRQTIERAREYVSQTGLDLSVPSVWDIVENWPHWIKLPSGRWNRPDGVTDIAGEGDANNTGVAWRWKGRNYRLGFVEKPNYSPDGEELRAEISLEVDHAPVCSFSCSKGPESFDEWQFSWVEPLTVGPWVSQFIEMARHLHAEVEAASRAYSAQSFRDQASRINLGNEEIK